MRLDAADPSAPPADSLDLGPAREVVTRAVRSGTLPCAVFGVADARGVLGTVAVDGRTRGVHEDSIFFLASVTKPIVATAVMQYVDEGRLDLHAPLGRYLPELAPATAEQVTAWHILTHSSGLPDIPVEQLYRERPAYARSLAMMLAAVPEEEPGTRFAYASAPLVLLAETMARLSGLPFPRALSLRLTGPLGMVDTTFDPRYDRRRAVSVTGLEVDNRLVEEIMLRFLARATLPGGGMFGTVRDLLRLGRALLPPAEGPAVDPPPRVLSRAAIEEMGRLHTEGLLETMEDGTPREARFGLGWAKPAEWMPGTPDAFTHGGAAGGRLWVDPGAGLAFVFLTNLWGAPDGVPYEVLDAVYRAREAT